MTTVAARTTKARNQRRGHFLTKGTIRCYNSKPACDYRVQLPRAGGPVMSGLDNYLAYAESHRGAVCAVSAGLIVLIAWGDWLLPTISIGFLYLVPVLLCAGVLNTAQILTLAVFCVILREVFDPLE